MKYIDILKDSILKAGEILKEGYLSKKEIHYKNPVDLATDYDLKIETFLINELADKFPNFTIISEEINYDTSIEDNIILIDPIDGTTNFVHGVPFFAISIGIWENGKPVAGMVYNPILNELFHAEAGKGAYLNGEKIAVSLNKNIQKSLIATGFPANKIEKGKDYEWIVESFKNLLPITRDIRRLGAASLDLCYVANGIFDGFYEINLKPWDVGAAILIILEAGGKISNKFDKPYYFDDNVIVASNKHIHSELICNL